MAARVWNDARWTLTCTQIHKQIKGKHFVVVSDEVAALVPQNGVFRVEHITDNKRSSKKDAEIAKLEQHGDKPSAVAGHTDWFAGGSKNAQAK